MRDVVGQLADATQDPAARYGPVALGGDNVGGHAKHTIGERARLTHQHVAFFWLELFCAGRRFPAHINRSAHHTRATCATGAGGTFIWEIQSLAKTRVEDRFIVTTIEAARTALAFDRYLHRAIRTLLEEIVVLFFAFIEFVD